MNEKTVFYSDTPLGNLPYLFVVADGIGGHSAGDYASSCTVRTIENEVMLNDETEPIKIMKQAVEAANAEVYRKAQTDPAYNGMGTTVVMGTVINDVLYVANVGDSRLYLIDEEITQITKDHSYVEEMVKSGEITAEEARIHPDRNIITRAVGVMESVVPDFFEVDVREEDRLLLCSDGLSGMVTDEEIFKIVREEGELDVCADKLIKLANHKGGKDNITVILVDPFFDENRVNEVRR